MATPKKAIPPKKTKGTQKPSSKISKSSITKQKTSNAVTVKSPSAKSQKNNKGGGQANGGGKSTKTPTPKSKKNGKRVKEEVEEEEDVKSYTFPMERVKRIIRSQDSDLRISPDAIFLVNKATEKFLEKFTGDAHKCCVMDRKKAIAYKHLSSVVCKQNRYEFLSDYVPEKVKAVDALAKRKQAEVGTS